MIIDAHCHAWRYWPYRPLVPDPESRAVVEQLLFEMEQCGVERAAIVCARIEHNPDNNDYVAECVRRYPGRLYQVADVDCSWSPEYQTPGAGDRLRRAAERYGLKAFTHYVRGDDDGSWYLSEEGRHFFDTAQELGLIASVSWPARLQPVLRQVAERAPGVVFLVHHMGGLKAAEAPPKALFHEVLASAALPNIHVKLSGFHHASGPEDRFEYPYPHCRELARGLYDSYGAHRLVWGSDYPVVRSAMTYRQSLEAVRRHLDFMKTDEMELVLGLTLQRLLDAAGGPPTRAASS
ncbi:MAG TPA: amidohydrolase family protein [Chloroflexota bacterium]|nr:amidohydrolase family protein [Chloroflexota bacterium]